MDYTFVWKAIVLVIEAVLLLRIAGRKSISQMTLAQTIVMIAIGTIIVEPIMQDSVIKTIISTIVFVGVLILFEYIQLKSNAFEKLITGKSKIIIHNGKLNVKELKRLRLTVDQLEMRLRNIGVSKIEDIKTATIEPNGLLGYELNEEAKPLTVGQFQKMMREQFGGTFSLPDEGQQSTIFNESKQHKRDYSEKLK